MREPGNRNRWRGVLTQPAVHRLQCVYPLISTVSMMVQSQCAGYSQAVSQDFLNGHYERTGHPDLILSEHDMEYMGKVASRAAKLSSTRSILAFLSKITVFHNIEMWS